MLSQTIPGEKTEPRPLTEEGLKDCEKVLEFFKNKRIDAFYSSPYKRSYDTIFTTANFFKKEIIPDEHLREREAGAGSNSIEMMQKRWKDKSFHEEGGESLGMVQQRNITALTDILNANKEKTLVIATHGTALSSILNYYEPSYNFESFMRIINWMPYIIELNFEGEKLLGKTEHFYIEKEFRK